MVSENYKELEQAQIETGKKTEEELASLAEEFRLLGVAKQEVEERNKRELQEVKGNLVEVKESNNELMREV